MRVWHPGALAMLLAGCHATSAIEEARLASPSPEIASCAQWFGALDREVAAAGVRDAQYSPVPGFPYLRADSFLAQSRMRASRSAAAFTAFADGLAHNDLAARRREIENLPAAVVEKWSGMRLEDSRSAAIARSAQCGRLLREAELARPEMRSALLARIAAEPPRRAAPACRPFAPGDGARVRYAPPPATVSRLEVAGWLLRGEVDPLGEPMVSERELAEMAPLYAPSLEVRVASDDDRFGALRWRRGAAHPQIDATEPAVYVKSSYARYEDAGLLQILYTVLFPTARLAWRVTLAPDGEPLLYEAVGSDGCRALLLTPRARLRGPADSAAQLLPRMGEDARLLVGVAAGTHEIGSLGVVHGADSLVRYTLKPDDELASPSGFAGADAAADVPSLVTEPLEARFAFDLQERRP
jgi:hypothetical protein